MSKVKVNVGSLQPVGRLDIGNVGQAADPRAVRIPVGLRAAAEPAATGKSRADRYSADTTADNCCHHRLRAGKEPAGVTASKRIT